MKMEALEQALGKAPQVEWIALGRMQVLHAAAQRTLNPRKAKKIADDLDPDALGLVVVMQPDATGQYHIIDGQHRHHALRIILGWGAEQKIMCLVLPTGDPERAAQLWTLINSGRAKPHTLDLFKVAVTGGAPRQTAIHELLTGLGYHIGNDKREGCFSAVDAALLIDRRHGQARLLEALLIIRGAWGMAAGTANAVTLHSIAEFLAEYGVAVEQARLVDRIAEEYDTPARFVSKARQLRELEGGKLSRNASRLLLTVYNRGLRSNKLNEQLKGTRFTGDGRVIRVVHRRKAGTVP
jgi:hypothetical protein